MNTTKKRWTSVLACAAAVASSLVVSGQSSAADAKVYSHAMCTEYTNAHNFGWHYDGVRNQDSTVSSRLLRCPIVRDNTTNTNGLSTVRLRGSSPVGAAVTCTLRALQANGSSSYTAVLTSGTAGGNFDVAATVSNSYNGGQYMLDCSLPQNGIIRNYLVEEF